MKKFEIVLEELTEVDQKARDSTGAGFTGESYEFIVHSVRASGAELLSDEQIEALFCKHDINFDREANWVDCPYNELFNAINELVKTATKREHDWWRTQVGNAYLLAKEQGREQLVAAFSMLLFFDNQRQKDAQHDQPAG